MKITAVLTSYWQERLSNVPKILEDLKSSSRPPDDIILLNNNNSYTIGRTDIKVLNSMHNFGAEGKFAAALFEPSDWYFFIDDDLTVQKHTLRNLENWSETVDTPVLSLIGQKAIDGQPYESGERVMGDEVDELTEVDVSLRIHFVRQDQVLTAARNIKPEYEGVDDIVLSVFSPEKPMVVPCLGGNQFIEMMNEGDVGYVRREDHYSRRNELYKKLSK